jgi:hypothetical protein
MLRKLGQGYPSSSIHVQMVFVLDKLLVYTINFHTFRSIPPGKELHEIMLELGGEVGDVSACVLANDEHLPKMRLRLGMTFEPVFVATLFLADLTVPAQPLESL